MSSNLVTFIWSVPVEGHRWHCWHDGEHSLIECPDPQLLEQADPRLAVRRRFDPFADAPSLYRAFAKVAPTREGVIAFADRWGPLFGWEGFADPAQPTGRQAELLSSWRRAISEVRSAVDLWDVLQGGSSAERQQLRLRFLQDRVVREPDHDGGVTLYYDTHADLPIDVKEAGDGYLRVRRRVVSDGPRLPLLPRKPGTPRACLPRHVPRRWGHHGEFACGAGHGVHSPCAGQPARRPVVAVRLRHEQRQGAEDLPGMWGMV